MNPEDELVCVVAATSAWPFYQASGAYVCQPHRRFRDATRLGFYSARTIHGLAPRIEHVFLDVAVSAAEAARRALSTSPLERRLGRALAAAVEVGADPESQVVLLSAPGDPATARIGDITHRGASAWTMFQRYETLGRLTAASDTADLVQETIGAE